MLVLAPSMVVGTDILIRFANALLLGLCVVMLRGLGSVFGYLGEFLSNVIDDFLGRRLVGNGCKGIVLTGSLVSWFSRSMLWASSLVLVAQLDRALRLDCLAWAIVDVSMGRR